MLEGEMHGERGLPWREKEAEKGKLSNELC